MTCNNQVVGTYQGPGDVTWATYSNTVNNAPMTQAIYWRSDTGGQITDAYTISVRVDDQDVNTAPANEPTFTRQLHSRLLSADDEGLRTRFNTDVDMLQRAMIQVFYLDKGMLDRYTIGQYERNGPPQEAAQNRFYHSSRPGRLTADWSKISDEVYNFRRFTIDAKNTSSDVDLRTVQQIWREFSLILVADVQAAIDSTSENYAQWLTQAAGALNLPQGFQLPNPQANAAEVLVNAIIAREGRTHSHARTDPLAVSSIDIGQARLPAGRPDHTYTDGGIGFMKLNPYHAREGENIYTPAGNLRTAIRLLNDAISHNRNPGGNDASRRVWYGVYSYNKSLGTGDFGNLTPAQMRALDPNTAGISANERQRRQAIKNATDYADAVFAAISVQLPQ